MKNIAFFSFFQNNIIMTPLCNTFSDILSLNDGNIPGSIATDIYPRIEKMSVHFLYNKEYMNIKFCKIDWLTDRLKDKNSVKTCFRGSLIPKTCKSVDNRNSKIFMYLLSPCKQRRKWKDERKRGMAVNWEWGLIKWQIIRNWLQCETNKPQI